MSKLKIGFSKGFSSWVSLLQQSRPIEAKVLIKALVAISENQSLVLDSVAIEDFKIQKVANQAPDLYRLVIITKPEIVVLFGLKAGWLIPGAWGNLQLVTQFATVNAAQNLIQSFEP